MQINKTTIDGCYEIVPKRCEDIRGIFVKTYAREVFAEKGLETKFAESYYTCSNKGVLRGLHVQTPPKEHAKLCYCPLGEVLDAVIDLRIGSPTYGKFETFKMNEEMANMLYIPPGVAHGFYVTSKKAIMVYMVSSEHSPENDIGILWNSAGIPWPDAVPTLSERDKKFPTLSDFKSPFSYKKGGN